MLTKKELIDLPLEKGTLGNAIRAARIEHSLSQERLAEMVEITPTHLKHIESGHRNPSVEVLIKLVQILHVSLDNIIFHSESERIIKQKEISNGLTQCSLAELQIISDLLHSLLKNRN